MCQYCTEFKCNHGEICGGGSNSALAAGCTESGQSVKEVVYIAPKDLTEEELEYFTEIIEPILKGHMVERRITLPKF